MNSKETAYILIDQLKKSLRKEELTGTGFKHTLYDNTSLVADEHDIDVLMDYMRSSETSIKSYLKYMNKTLHIISNLSLEPSFVQVPLEPIAETTETNSTPSKTNVTEDAISNQLNTDTIELSSFVESNASMTLDQSMSLEQEKVQMIRMKRMDTNLQYIHRSVFLDVSTLSSEQRNRIIEGLTQREKGSASLMDCSFYEVKEDEQSKMEFPAKIVLNTVWSIEQRPEKIVETSLFSSWKTKVNYVFQRILNKDAIGFVDISNEGLNVYE